MTAIAPLIESFFRDRLKSERGVSQNTQNTYAYAFQLLFEFAANRLKKKPSSLYLEDIDASMVTIFLEYLETDRGNSPVTRNARLAAIKSFIHFVEYRIPSALEQVRRILAIPLKKTDSRLIPHLNKEEIDALIDSLKSTTRSESRDRAMIYLCITGGLRVSELIGLKINDLSLQPDPTIRIHGKGRKERALPLWKETVDALQSWLAVRCEVKAPKCL